MDTEQKIDTAQEFLKADGNIIKTRDKFAGGIRDLGLRCHLPKIELDTVQFTFPQDELVLIS